MLLVAKKFREFNMGKLLRIYEEEIQHQAKKTYYSLGKYQGVLEAEQDFYTYYADFLRDDGTFVCVWMNQTDYVSALRVQPYRDGVLLTAIETAPKSRRRGFASSLLSETVSYLKASGVKNIYSHIAAHNIASVNLHLQCGFQKISHGAVLLDGSASSQMGTYLRKI